MKPSAVITSAGTIRPLLLLAAPVLLEQILNMLVAFVDQWLAGRYLEADHLAAIGLVWYVLWLIPTLFGIVAVGATAMIARFAGAGEWGAAVRTTNQSIAAGALLCLAAMALSWLFAAPFVRVMQLQPEAARLALRYLWILIPVYPAIMIEQVGIACLRGAGDTLSGFAAMTLVNVVNLVVGVGLVTGVGPFPQWGWDGLAIGTAAGHAAGAIVVLALLALGRANLKLDRSCLRLDFDLVRRLLRIGVPGGADMLAVVFCHLWFLSIINALGTIEAAGHGLSVRIESLAYLPGIAFQVAAATMAGQYLGARDLRRASRSVMHACLACGALMCAAGLVMYFGAKPLTMFFLGSRTQDVAEIAAPLLRVVSFSMPSLALLMVLTGALRGAGDTRWPLAITFIGLIGVRIPLAYLFAWSTTPIPGLDGFAWGVIGAWYAMVADVVIRSLLVLARFAQGGWRRIEV